MEKNLIEKLSSVVEPDEFVISVSVSNLTIHIIDEYYDKDNIVASILKKKTNINMVVIFRCLP